MLFLAYRKHISLEKASFVRVTEDAFCMYTVAIPFSDTFLRSLSLPVYSHDAPHPKRVGFPHALKTAFRILTSIKAKIHPQGVDFAMDLYLKIDRKHATYDLGANIVRLQSTFLRNASCYQRILPRPKNMPLACFLNGLSNPLPPS